jgi:hypothetical protein
MPLDHTAASAGVSAGAQGQCPIGALISFKGTDEIGGRYQIRPNSFCQDASAARSVRTYPVLSASFNLD